MKRASMTLGIAAGVIGLIGAFFIFQTIDQMFSFSSTPESIMPNINMDSTILKFLEDHNDSVLYTQRLTALGIVTGVLCTVGSVAGVTGGALVRKNSAVACALMVAGGVLNVLSSMDFILVIPLLLGGIFALLSKNESVYDTQRKGGALKTTVFLLGVAGGSMALIRGAQGLAMNIIDDLNFYGEIDPYTGSIALLIVIGSAAAIAGGLLVKKRHVLAGLLMLIGAAASLLVCAISSSAFPFMLLLVGGVFAFVSESMPSPELISQRGEPQPAGDDSGTPCK